MLAGSSRGKGFIPLDNRPGMFIAFAAEPGHTASDFGENGWPYAKAFAAEIVNRRNTTFSCLTTCIRR